VITYVYRSLYFAVSSTQAGSECWVSVRRIQKYLESPELSEQDSEKFDKQQNHAIELSSAAGGKDMPAPSSGADNTENPASRNADAITISNVTCYWDEADSKVKVGACGSGTDTGRAVALANINLSLKMNDLTCIVGAVGSGKSALLYALAGELAPSEGRIDRCHSSLAYAAQDSWIMNGA